MSDVVVTVPKGMWSEWLEEGDLPGEDWSGYVSHFWIPREPFPTVSGIGGDDRVYIVAHGKLRGYSPVCGLERSCRMRPSMACLMRKGDAVAVTVPEKIIGFRGWRYRFWDRADEIPFPDWRIP